MSQRLFFIILLHLICLSLFSTTLEVNLDGSTPYLTIQSAIDASVDADTVLVHPGTYYENINFNGKSISLASLFLTTQDEDYINQTIIDGNQMDTVVKIESGETAVISGLSIMNGKNDDELEDGHGGGIYLLESGLSLFNCIVKDNIAKTGGGLDIEDSFILFESCSIKNNLAVHGGGICTQNSTINFRGIDLNNNNARMAGGGICGITSSFDFAENNRSNIYLNSSSRGSDIYLANSQGLVIVYADTLTVFEPDLFFCCSIVSGGLSNHIIIDQLNAKIEPIDADIYVSPNGSDENDGLTENTPFKTIRNALIHTQPNSENPHIIHLLPGTYSQNDNGEILPLTFRDYTTISGSDRAEVFLDADSKANLLIDRYSSNIKLSNVTLCNGNNDDMAWSIYKWDSLQAPNNSFILDHVTVRGTSQDDIYGSVIYLGDIDVTMNKFESINNNCGIGQISNFTSLNLNHKIASSIFRNNPSSIAIGSRESATLRDSVKIINTLFENNYYDDIEWGFGASALHIKSKTIADIVNCTFVHNIYDQPDNGGALLIKGWAIDLNIYNSIFYGNAPYNIYVLNDNADWPIGLDIDYSLVENGEESVYAPLTSFNYGGNNLEADPLFMGDNALFPYALSAESPCIDAGTLDLPEWVELPETDLAGNPRVNGESIDMGCYEYTEFATPIDLEVDVETGVLFWSPPSFEYPVNYKLFLNGEYTGSVSGEIYQYNFSEQLEENINQTVGVSAVYTTGESNVVELEFIYNPVFGENNEIELVETRITNYPNPFNPSSGTRGSSTTIKFELAEPGRVDLAIYNIKGQKLTMLMDAWSEKGVFEMEWDGRDDYGKSVASGTYFTKCSLDGEVVTAKKMTLIK